MVKNLSKMPLNPSPIDRIRTPANQIIDSLKSEMKMKQPLPTVPGVKLLLKPKAKPTPPAGLKFEDTYH